MSDSNSTVKFCPKCQGDTERYYTYFHTRNDTGEVFYVGKGKGRRSRDKNHNPHWKHIVAKHGHTVHVAMTRLTEAEAFEHEKFLIVCFKGIGVPIVNRTDGGEGVSGLVCSPEHRAKISAANMGRAVSTETRAKISAANTGKINSPEARAKISAARTGYVHTPEDRKNMSAAVTRRMANPEQRAKISAASKGRVHTPETRARISAAKRGHTTSPETRAKISASLRRRAEGVNSP